MRKYLVIILTLISFGLKAQTKDISEQILDTLYYQAINGRIDLMLQGGPIFFEQNEVTSRIQNKIVHFKFLNDQELIQKSLENKETINAIRITHKVISRDTIDVNFGIVSVTAKRKIHFNKGLRFIKANFSIACGGTNGYNPDFRFVFNQESKYWDLLTNRYLEEMNQNSH